MRRRLGLIGFSLSLLAFAATLGAQTVCQPSGIGYVDLPAGWSYSASQESYLNRTGQTGLQVVKESDAESAKALYDSELRRLGARGEGVGFSYSDFPAYIGEVVFQRGSGDFKGYLVAIAAPNAEVSLLGYSSVSHYVANFDEMLSALDSFSLTGSGLREPGAISQFYYPFPAKKREPTPLFLLGRQYTVGLDVRELDASQVLIDRETRVLSENKAVNTEAWRRFYRIIFRDNYHRLDPFVSTVVEGLDLASKSPKERAVALLKWMQGYLYARTGTLADLSNPLLTLATQTGDCDSRTLLYSILLEHLGVKTILMVSAVYSHSMVGVLVPGKGARYEYGGKEYLVAELTANVEIGMIDGAMADPKGWIPVDFATVAD